MIYVIDATIRYSYSVLTSLYSIFNFLPLGLRYDVTSHVESPASADERSNRTPLVVSVVQGGQVVRMDILQPSPCWLQWEECPEHFSAAGWHHYRILRKVYLWRPKGNRALLFLHTYLLVGLSQCFYLVCCVCVLCVRLVCASDFHSNTRRRIICIDIGYRGAWIVWGKDA